MKFIYITQNILKELKPGTAQRLKVEGLIELLWWWWWENLLIPRPLEGRKMRLSKKTVLLYVLVYIQQFSAENISVENPIIVIAYRAIFEKSEGSIATASPMAARCLAQTECKSKSFDRRKHRRSSGAWELFGEGY